MLNLSDKKLWKPRRKQLLRELMVNNKFHFYHAAGGSTYLFVDTMPRNSRRTRNTYMMSVAVCNPTDEYSRKYGEYVTLERFMRDADYTLVPKSLMHMVHNNAEYAA